MTGNGVRVKRVLITVIYNIYNTYIFTLIKPTVCITCISIYITTVDATNKPLQ